MYNRYIPNRDGTYQKQPVPETVPQAQPAVKETQPTPAHNPPEAPGRNNSILGFLKNILPRDFDTADLIIVLLLLLLADERKEDDRTALLTLALYFFM